MKDPLSDIQSLLDHPDRRRGMVPNLLLFGKVLRCLGVPITPSMTIDTAQSLSVIDVGDKEEFYYTLRANMISRKEEIPIFEEAFKVFWEGHDVLSVSEVSEKEWGEIHWEEVERGDEQVTETLSYSPHETLSEKKFRRWEEIDAEEMKRVLSQMLSPLTTKPSRRYQWGRKGKVLDLRRTLRESTKYGGELLHLFRKRRKIKKRRVIFLCDVSGSMDIYTSFILFFIHGLKQIERGAEVFIFSTRLTRITPLLERYSFPQFLEGVSKAAPDWSGGTRIGECLKDFNQRYALSVVRPDSIFLVYSDGWDRGSPQLLKSELGRIRRRAAEIIWLNPLMGYPSYQPICQGMKAALPYIDHLLPAHNYASLRNVARVLARS